ncbi:MAG: tRNA 4-thiouridine(8) synthase ThiI [Deltaproteobacteria bacterium]|nr:tRNA 4-thiouridine(8) synthase ThiI [Deltaproteobacteria bacterium]
MISTSQQKKPVAKTGRQVKSNVVRALGLTSGGLDSILSALVLRDQGIEVAWINFETPFFASDKAREAARMTGISLMVKNITGVYIEMLRNPNCGYGANMNPCLDCHALMFQIAGSIMKKEGFDFLFSGEVVGQRPMSQTKPSLRYVEKNSGFDGYILRPLSAKLLPLTIPEELGLVDRERLLGISGRGRKEQIKLAEAFGVTQCPAPAGGCLLTDSAFCKRLKDLFDHQDDCQERDLELLKYGRHFRLREKHKVIVGRTKDDNKRISSFADPCKDIKLRMTDMPSPIVLIPYGAPGEIVHEAATLCAAHSKAPDGQPARVSVKAPGGSSVLTVLSAPREEYHRYLI